MQTKPITIIGAGLSGMVAGINLARAGYEIEIWDAAKKIGQLEEAHPSMHATPIDPLRVSQFIGIDISPCFIPLKHFRINVQDKTYYLNPQHFHVVERGGRKSSADTYLYKMALAAGIKFRFNTWIRQWSDVPENAIVATGLNKEGMEAVGIPFDKGTAAYARKKLDDPYFDASCVGWAGPYTTDYGYLSVANDLMFFLMFNRGPLTDKEINQCREHIRRTDGLEFPEFHYEEGHIPLLGPDSLKLFKGNRILTGTICGMIDPAGLYGIHGALMAGKVAALAITDTEQALVEFKRLNKNYERVRTLSALMRRMPFRLPFMHMMFSAPQVFGPALKLLDDGIPGYTRHWGLDMLEERRRFEEKR